MVIGRDQDDAHIDAPWRHAFDVAATPYSARNALGIAGTGAGLITSVSAPLAVTGGNLTVDLSGYQPLDADLTAIAALTGTNTIYYRSGTSTWSAVNVSTGLAFSGGNLTSTATIGGITSVVLRVITSSTTYTPTSGMKFCIVEVIGGGGGGGAGFGTAAMLMSGGGGGAGGYARARLTAAQVGVGQTVTIGAAGAGGTAVANATAGGQTSFGALCVAAGGGGGTFSQNGVGSGAGGAGGAPVAGDTGCSGSPGASGFYNTTGVTIQLSMGAGGSSFFGGGATAVSASSNGNTAGGYGGGGGGAYAVSTATNFSGGAGSPGICIITEFI